MIEVGCKVWQYQQRWIVATLDSSTKNYIAVSLQTGLIIARSDGAIARDNRSLFSLN